MDLTQINQLHNLAVMRKQLPVFANNILKIQGIEPGDIIPFRFNPVQVYAHQRIEAQLARTGMVRMLIPKSRRATISSYVAARYYHKASLNRGRNVYILSHEQSTTNTLFDIVDRFQRNNVLAPSIGKTNVQELIFDKLDSSYAVATAGNEATGRGRTIHLYHGSEVAYWKNADKHFASSVQAVARAPGTEIILESTGAGPAGEFYERCQQALAGKGDYEVLFVPWHMSPENSSPPPSGFELSDDKDIFGFSEIDIAEMHKLSHAQMFWRRNKLLEVRSPEKFALEFPATLEECFTATREDSFLTPESVFRARKRWGTVQGGGPLVMGVDPSGGKDRFSVAFRRGYVVEHVDFRTEIEAPEANDWVASLIDKWKPDAVFIDAGGLGKPIISYLRAKGPQYGPQRVKAINFGSPSQFKNASPHMPGPKNRRAEMYDRLREWLELPEGVAIPDRSDLQADLTLTKRKASVTNDLQLMAKDELKAKFNGRSPDLADAIALTFAESVYVRPADRTVEKVLDHTVGSVYVESPYGYEGGAGGSDNWMS